MSINKIKGAVTLPKIRTGAPEPPYTYLGITQQVMKGVKILASSSEEAVISLYILAAHVLECSLKAYLAKQGYSEKKLRERPYGHNLGNLWKEAEAKGLKIQTMAPDWVNRLSELHGGPRYLLRYSTGVHAIVGPPIKSMVSELGEILATVQSQI